MKKYHIRSEEEYPVFFVKESPDGKFEFDDDFIERYNAAADEWDAVQDILDKAVVKSES